MFRLTCFILFICSAVSANSIIVKTASGEVRGKLVHDEITGTSFYAFLNIPYAEAPTGERRYMPPVPKKPWRGVYDATEPGPVCPQREGVYTRDQMSEDCLRYNVYVPANRTKSMSVLFHIHAGNFDSLSGNPTPVYGTQIIVQSNIVVTLNYRLGALGFLSVGNEKISGNAGLKDVVLALKTVKKNIEKFGGDPNKITINGQEASGAICGYLMLIPETKSLFRNAVIHSGSLLSSKYLQFNPTRNALSLADEMNIKYRNDGELIKKLKSANAYDIVKATEAIIMKDPQRGYRVYNPFTPTVETVNKNAIITKPVLRMIQEGGLHDKPVACGFNTEEGLDVYIKSLKNQPNLVDKFNENHELITLSGLEHLEECARKNVTERMWDFYFGSNNTSLAKPGFINLISDGQYNYPMDLFVRLFVQTKKSPIYYFLFGLDSELNYAKAAAHVTYPGCAANDEIGYVFVTDVTRPLYKNLSAATKELEGLTVKVISDFTSNGVPPGLPEPWPTAGPDRYHVSIMNSGPQVVKHGPYPERMDFWNSIYEEYFN